MSVETRGHTEGSSRGISLRSRLWPGYRSSHPRALVVEANTKSAKRAIPPDGLTLLHENGDIPIDSKGTFVDIIAVHGLNGHPENTWRHNDGHFWLTESLVDSLKPHSVSIWTYGYDASRFFRKSSSTVRIIAETFLRFLSGRANFLTSKTKFSRPRKIIFIGHSLGGLVIKKAILLAKNNYKDRYPDLYPSIYGAVFLGTPHQGSALANYGTNLMRLFRLNTALVEFLQKGDGNEELKTLTADFATTQDGHLRVISVCEQLPVRGLGIIVPETSSVLGWAPGREEKVYFQCDHSNLSKLKGPEDSNYQQLLFGLQDMVKEASQISNVPGSVYNDLLTKLDCNNYRRRHVDFTNATSRFQHCPKTCEWIFREESQFRQWYEAYKSTNIWLTGHVGCGKSTLSAYFLDSFEKQERRHCFYYFFGTDERSKLLTTALESILFQILDIWGPFTRLPEELQSLHSGKSGDWSITQLGEAIRSILEVINLDSVYIVIDGLDEFSVVHHPSPTLQEDRTKRLREFLTTLLTMDSRLQSSSKPGAKLRTKLKCLLTSRPHTLSDVMDLFSDLKGMIHHTYALPAKFIEEDIRIFIAEERRRSIEVFCNETSLPDSIRSKLDRVSELVSKTAGTSFLVARFIMQKFSDPTHFDSPALLNRIISEIEQFDPMEDSDALSGKALAQEYRGIMDLIGKREDDRARFKRLFQWLVVNKAERGLGLSEARAILDFNEKAGSLDEFTEFLILSDDRAEITIRRHGASLFRISAEKRVEWYHASAQEFVCFADDLSRVERKSSSGWWSFSRGEAGLEIALLCLAYLKLLRTLNFDFLAVAETSERSGDCSLPPTTERTPDMSVYWKTVCTEARKCADKYPLLDYVVQNGTEHIRQYETAVLDRKPGLVQEMVNDASGLVTACRFRWYSKYHKTHTAFFPKTPSYLHAFAYLGLKSFAVEFLKEESWRAESEYLATKEPEFTPLHLAAMTGNTPIVMLLLDGLRKDNRMQDISTLLFGEGQEEMPASFELALDQKHPETARALVSSLDLNAEAADGPKALELAVRYGSREIIQDLVEKGININCKLPKHGSVLEEAALRGDVSLVEFLLDLDASAAGTFGGDVYGHPLAAAAYMGNNRIIEVLKSRGNADINQERGPYTTALEAAASANCAETVLLLLNLGSKRELVKDTALLDSIASIAEKQRDMLDAPTQNSDSESNPSTHAASATGAILQQPSGTGTLRTKASSKLRFFASNRSTMTSVKSLSASVVRAREEVHELQRRVEVNFLTQTTLGQGFFDIVALNTFTLAIKTENTTAMNVFADLAMDLLYTALERRDEQAISKITNEMWLVGMKKPVALGKTAALEKIIRRCLSRFEKLVVAGTSVTLERALVLVRCGIEMFLAIAEDGDKVLLTMVADLWSEYFEWILDKDKRWFFFRERVVGEIHEYRKRFMNQFHTKKLAGFGGLGRYTRAALSALVISLEKRRYSSVDRLTSIMLGALDEILEPSPEQTKLRGPIQWLSIYDEAGALESLRSPFTQDLIERLLHVGARLMYIVFVFNENDPEKNAEFRELRVRKKRFAHYAASVLITAVAIALAKSALCFEYLQATVMYRTILDIKIRHDQVLTEQELHSSYRKLFKKARKQANRKYDGQSITNPTEIRSVGAAKAAIDFFLIGLKEDPSLLGEKDLVEAQRSYEELGTRS